MQVTMIGTGYVGLVSGICFAEIGHSVTCVDVREDIIELLRKGKSPIFEPGLSDLIRRNIRAKRIDFSTDYKSVGNSQVIFLAVGTPSSDSGEANLEYLKEAAISVAKELRDDTIVVIKSTVPVGTSEQIRRLIAEHTASNFYLVSNPEFLKEGSAIDDFMKPDRVIIGRQEEYATKVMEELYAPLVRQGNPILMMSNSSAELAKYASNCFLATKISFINEIARLCDKTGADIEQVRHGMTADRRIGPHFLYPGPGYGGSCFPKDVKALIHTAKCLDLNVEIVEAAEKVNKRQKIIMFEKMKKHFAGDLKNKKFAFWGVSFKPNTDDIREAPSIEMFNALVGDGASIHFFDPEASDNFMELSNGNEKTKGRAKSFANKYDCLEECHGLVVITEWAEFRAPDFYEIKSRLREANLFDARNLYKTETVLEYGFNYYAIGKYIERER